MTDGTTAPPVGQIRTKLTAYKQLTELSREQVSQVWQQESTCQVYFQGFERAIRSTPDPRKYLYYFEWYLEECTNELNLIPTPCYQPENFGKAGVPPDLSPSASTFITVCTQPHTTTHNTHNTQYNTHNKSIQYTHNTINHKETLQSVVESLAYTRPSQTSVFAINHLYRSTLVLCKRCIELDIECFRIMEIVFGFVPRQQNSDRFYDCCGRPRISHNYQNREYTWTPKDYANGEMQLFMRITDLHRLIKQNQDTREELHHKQQAYIELQKDADIEYNRQKQEYDQNIASANASIANNTATNEEINLIMNMNNNMMNNAPMRMIYTLTNAEMQQLQNIQLTTDNYTAELSLVSTEANKIYEISDHNDYPSSFAYCGASGEDSCSQSWFLVQNVNYFGRIKGFDSLITRIAHAKCAVAVSDLVNLIRPIAQMRDLLNTEFFDAYITKLQSALRSYYKELPDIVVRELNKQTVEKSLKNMHYMMNNRYETIQISKAKELLKLQIASRQFRAPYVNAKIFGMNDINKFIELAIDKAEYLRNNANNSAWKSPFTNNDDDDYNDFNSTAELKKKGSGGSSFTKGRQQAIDNLWLDVQFLENWISEEKVLEFILDRKTTHIELVRRIGPIYKLLLFTQTLKIGKHVDPLWKLTLGGQHESIRHLVYDLMTESLSKGLDLNETKHLFQQIAKTPKPEYDIQILQLIKKITIQAFKRQEEAVGSDGKKSWFGLDLLWRFVQCADQTAGTNKNTRRLISEKIAREALNIFLELLATDYAISQRNAYMEKCIWHIQESSKVVQNLQLLQQLIQTFPRTIRTWYGSETTQKPNTQAGVIERLEKDYALIDHLLQDLAFYKGTVMSVLQIVNAELKEMMAENSPSPSSVSLSSTVSLRKPKVQTLRVDDSSYGYLEQLKIRLDFLLFLLTHSTLRLTRSQYRRIWDHLVDGALCREEMDLCYIWLLRGSVPPHYSAPNDSHYKLYNQQDQRYLFENCIRRLPAAHLSETGYLLVVSFFCSVNKRSGTLSIKGEKKLLPRRAGDERRGANMSKTIKGGISKLTQMANNTGLGGKVLNSGKKNEMMIDTTATVDGKSNTTVNTSSSSSFGNGLMSGFRRIDSHSPTKRTRDHLQQYMQNINTDLLNEDGTYLIDPDHHFIDTSKLRVIDYDSLDGISYFWDVVLKSKLPEVGVQAIQLLNALHFYFATRIKDKDADTIRQLHVQKCLKYLDQALNSGSKKSSKINTNTLVVKKYDDRDLSNKHKIVVKRMIMLLKQFLESFLDMNRLQEDFIDIEIHPDKEFRTQKYIIVCKITDTFSLLRKKVWQKLSRLNTGLTIDHLILKWNNRYTITQYEHDRYKLSKLDWKQSRVLVVKRVRHSFVRHFWSVSNLQQPIADTYVYPIQSSTPAPLKKELLTGFKRVQALSIFSQDQHVYGQLFPLLQSPKIGPAVWDILNLLPPSHIRVRRVLELGFETGFNPSHWEQLFDVEKPYQLLYYLQILCGILSGTEWRKEYFSGNRLRTRTQVSHLEWIQRFVDLGGFSFMCKLLFANDLTSAKNKNKHDEIARRIHVSSAAFLFQIVSLLLSMDKEFQSVRTPPRCIKSGSITNAKDFTAIEAKLIKTALNVSDKILLWADMAEQDKQEMDHQRQLANSKTSNEFYPPTKKSSESLLSGVSPNLIVSHNRKELKVDRSASDFSDLTRVNDLGPNGATILVECLEIMIGCMRTSPKFVETLYNMENLTKWLSSLSFNTQYPETRHSVSVALQMLARVKTDTVDDNFPGSSRLLNELVKILSSHRACNQNSNEFFDLFMHVFDHVCRAYKHINNEILEQVQNITKQVYILLQEYSSIEKYQTPEIVDEYLLGLINILRISVHNQLLEGDHEIDEFCTFIFYDCLFNVPQQEDYGAKCKAAHSRQQTYGLLHCVMEKYPQSLAVIQSLVLRDPIWYHISKQNLLKASWSYHPSDLERFPIRYAGLKNQGATCYMNSLVQQLFVVDEFRKSILASRVDNDLDQKHMDDDEDFYVGSADDIESGAKTDVKSDRELLRRQWIANKKAGLRNPSSVLYQVQLMFGYLMKSQKRYYDTMPLCKVLKGFDGQPLPLGEQQDVNEFCSRLFDQLEDNLKGTTHANCIADVFGGTIINQMISKDEQCDHRSEREEMFHTVSLTVANKANLQESLDFYVEGDLLDNDNKYLCSKCNVKITALKRSCFGQLPKYLFLHLSRFEFDFNAMRNKKVNSRLEFPLDLDLKKYTKEGLAMLENENKRNDDEEDGNGGGDEEKKSEEDDEEIKMPEIEEPIIFRENAYYNFKLVGVVVHTGGADSGHYYSFAQSSDNQWWEFNDVDVTPFDVADLDEECYGGKHIVKIEDPKNKGKKIEEEQDKPYTAYMLIYKQMLGIESSKTEPRQSFIQEEKSLQLPAPIQHTIWQENLKFLSDKNVFDFDYLSFLWQTVHLASIRGQSAAKYKKKMRNSSSSSRNNSRSDNVNISLNNESSNVSSVALAIAKQRNSNPSADAFQAIQIATLFVFEILLRAKDNGSFPKWMKLLYKMYQSNENGRKWLLNKVCTSKQWFLNTMFYNAHKSARLAFGDLLLAVLFYQRSVDMQFYDEFVDRIQKDEIDDGMVDDEEYAAQLMEESKNNNEQQQMGVKAWPDIEKKSIEDMIAVLSVDKYSCARFMAFMFEFLHTVPQYHQYYEQFFSMLKGIAFVGFAERKLLIRLGVIRSLVGFYMNDTPLLHFNRQVVGRNDQGQRQTRRIAPPRVNAVVELLTVLIRSSATDTFPDENNSYEEIEAKSNVNQVQANGNANVTALPTNTVTQQYGESQVHTISSIVMATQPPDINTNGGTAGDASFAPIPAVSESIIDTYSVVINDNTMPYGYPPHCVLNEDGNHPQPIKLSNDDLRCLWNGLDPKYSDDGQSTQMSSCLPWTVPLYIDPLPSQIVYKAYSDEQQILVAYKKKHNLLKKKKGKSTGMTDKKIFMQLPSNMKQIADKTGALKNLSPRKLYQINILDWLFRDRSGPNNTCMYEKDIMQVFIYWCFNNGRLSDIIFEYLHRKVAEEFKSAHEYGLYLEAIAQLLLCKDMNYEKKINTYVPKMIQLLMRCSKTEDTGTDLLIFQLTSWIVRMSFREPLIAAHMKQNENMLQEINEEYRKNHAVVIDAHAQYGTYGTGGGGYGQRGGGGRGFGMRGRNSGKAKGGNAGGGDGAGGGGDGNSDGNSENSSGVSLKTKTANKIKNFGRRNN